MIWSKIYTNVLLLVLYNIKKRVVYLKKYVSQAEKVKESQWRYDENESNITEPKARAAIRKAGSSCFDTHPAFPVTTSLHLPQCASGAASWELLSHPSLSSFKLSVSCRREDFSEFGSKWLNVVCISIWSHLIIQSFLAALRIFCLITDASCDFFWTQSNERDWAGKHCSSTPHTKRSVMWHTDSHRVSFSWESCAVGSLG